MKLATGRRVGVLVMIALSLFACSDWFIDEQQLMRNAADYLAERKFNAAAIELRNVLQENPGRAEARYLLATIYLDFGDYESADKEFRHARASGWNESDVEYGLARSQLGMGNFRGVVEDMEVSETWPAPVRASLLSLRAVAMAGLGMKDEALAQFDAAQQLDSGSLEVLRTGIKLQIVYGNIAETEKYLQHALKQYPSDPELLLLQASITSQDEQAAARAIYQRVMDMDPHGFISANGRLARLRLTQLQILDRDYEDAAVTLKPLFHRDANDPFTNYLGGVLAFEQSDYRRAAQLLLEVLKLAPEHNPTRLLYGTVNFAEKNYEQAAYFLSKYLTAVPDNLDARKLLARSYILLRRYDDASKTLKSVLTGETSDAELLALVGVSELNRGDTAAGIVGLERAVKIDPGSVALRAELAKAYIEAGDTGLAISQLETMLAQGGEQRQTEILLILAHLRAGEIVKAIGQSLDLVKQEPDDPAVHALTGNVFAASGDLAEARIYLMRSMELQPGFPPAAMALAYIEEQEGKYVEASRLYGQLVDTGMESVLPMLALARIAELQGDREAVSTWLERALKHAPGDVKPLMFLADYHLRDGHPGLARPLVREAREIFPHEPVLLALSARIFIAENKFRQALQPLQQLVAREPESAIARILLGEVYLRLGRLEDARRELMIALDSTSSGVQARALLAELEIRAGEYEQALKYSREIQQALPEEFAGYELAGDSLMAAEKYTAAADEYARAWERMPAAGLVIKRAESAFNSGKPDVAIGYIQDWLREHPDDIEALESIGTAFQNMGEADQAMAIYEKIIRLDADNVVALNNLAGLYMLIGRPVALGYAERAWQLAPENPNVRDTYGWALVLDGQVGRGLRLLEQALEALPLVPEVRYHHAAAVYQAGNKSKARQLLEALLDEGAVFQGREDAKRLLQ